MRGERPAVAERPARARPRRSGRGAATAPARARILLVEDDFLLAETVREWLELAGYEVAGIAGDERGAVDLARGRRPDLAVVDVRLGGAGDGIATARTLDRAVGTPALFLTGFPDGLDEVDVGLGWMVKPAREPDFLAAVEAALALAAGALPLHPPAALRLNDRAGPELAPRVPVPSGDWARALLESAPHGIAVVDRDLRIVDANRALAERLGLEPAAIQGVPLDALAFGDDGLCAMLETCFSGRRTTVAEREWVAQRADGEAVLFAVRGGLAHEGEAARAAVVLHLRDVVEATPATLRPGASLHDHLTGLGTAAFFTDRLELACARAARAGTAFAVLLVELVALDRLQRGIGAAAVNGLLAEVAGRIDDRRREVDTAARLAGGLFALVLDGTTHEGAMAVARELTARIRRPVALAGGAVEVEASIGVAWAGAGVVAADTVFQRADAALCRARDLGPNTVVGAGD